MFRMILRLILPLSLLCVVLVTLAPRLDQRAVSVQSDWPAYGFDACPLPCWAGLTTGETTFARTLPALRANVSAFSDFALSPSQIYIWGRRAPTLFSGLIYYAQERINAIRLNITLPPDQLIVQLGLPDCVNARSEPGLNLQGNVVYWLRDGRSIGAWIQGESVEVFQPGAAVYALWISTDDLTVCKQKGATPWRGAAAWWRYAEWGSE